MQSVDTEMGFDLFDDGEDEPCIYDKEAHKAHNKQHLLIHNMQIRIERQNHNTEQTHEFPVHVSAAEMVHIHMCGEEGIGQTAED